MYCRNCGNEMLENASYCVNCGVSRGKGDNYCPSCGKSTNKCAEVCINCGVRLKSRISFDTNHGLYKNKLIAILLCIFVGCFGIHRFYLGDNNKGFIILALTLGGFLTLGITSFIAGIWVIIDLILIILDKIPDSNGNIPQW